MSQKYLVKYLVIIILAFTGLACGLGDNREQVGPPSGSIPVSQEATDRLKQNFNQALQEASGNHMSQLRVTNEEITSLVAIELTQTGQLPLSDPQIWFTAGRIYITGKVKAFGFFNLNSFIVATALVDNGGLVVKVQEAQMGPFDFPDELLQSITETVNETLAGILIDLEITRLEIFEGEMFVVGMRRTSS
ncbi:MAG: hypothetical protein JXM69_05880 [Anaerolineae bacterium]|nr:hypothetical protein [Anaerolineae bacterium]